MIWRLSDRFDPIATRLADQHYSRQSPGTPQFVAPGRTNVLVDVGGCALWVSLWQKHVRHQWPGAWNCALFRNVGAGLSSELIRDAVAATRWRWGGPPAEGMITFVNASCVRRKRDPGRCFLRAGFRRVGETAGGLLAFRLDPADFPEAAVPHGARAHQMAELFP